MTKVHQYVHYPKVVSQCSDIGQQRVKITRLTSNEKISAGRKTTIQSNV